MIEVRQTEAFQTWLAKLADERAQARIAQRLARLAQGNFGDHKSVGEGVFELRIDYGPGYRIYGVRRGRVVVIVLCGGDKRTQDRDIRTAKEMAGEID